MNGILKYMMPMMMMVVVAGVLQMVIPKAPEPTGFKCPYCDLYFPTLTEIAAHVTEAHPDMPPFMEVEIDWGQTQ